MFRRREDGTEELITDATEKSSATATTTPAPATAAATPAATPATPVNPVPAAPAAQAASFRPAPPQAAMAATRSAVNVNPTPAAPSAPATPSVASEAVRTAATPTARPATKRVLTVGPEIQMKGEIASCDRVVIEGVVDATMRDVHTVELTETGTLKGTAEVEDAEISGTFEGDLLVRGKLTIHASGRVRGNVTYGEVEIQRGGQITGNVRNVADAKNAALPNNKSKAA